VLAVIVTSGDRAKPKTVKVAELCPAVINAEGVTVTAPGSLTVKVTVVSVRTGAFVFTVSVVCPPTATDAKLGVMLEIVGGGGGALSRIIATGASVGEKITLPLGWVYGVKPGTTAP